MDTVVSSPSPPPAATELVDTMTESEISITAVLLLARPNSIDRPLTASLTLTNTPPSLSTKSPQVEASAALEGGSRQEILW